MMPKTQKAHNDDDYKPENQQELRPRLYLLKTATKHKHKVSPVNLKQTNSRKITGLMLELVNPKLLKGYKVNKNLEVCYIFNFVPLAGQWKASTKYTKDTPDIEYDPHHGWTLGRLSMRMDIGCGHIIPDMLSE